MRVLLWFNFKLSPHAHHPCQFIFGKLQHVIYKYYHFYWIIIIRKDNWFNGDYQEKKTIMCWYGWWTVSDFKVISSSNSCRNVIASLEFKLNYYNVTVHHIIHYILGTTCIYIYVCVCVCVCVCSCIHVFI